MPRLTSGVAVVAVVVSSWATPVMAPAGPPLWLRYPAISPDGQTIAFSYRGDIYAVPAAGTSGLGSRDSVGHQCNVGKGSGSVVQWGIWAAA